MADLFTQPPPRSWFRRFLLALDSEGVELFQWVFYVIIATDGAQNLFIAHGPPLTLYGSMSYSFFQYWCTLEMVAPLLGLTGRYIQHTTDFRKTGDLFQIVGDAVLGSSEVAYVIATFQIEPVGHGGHGGYLGLAFTISAYLLAFRDYRRFRSRA